MHHIDCGDQMTNMRWIKGPPKEADSEPRSVLVDQGRRRNGHSGSLRAAPQAHIPGQKHRLIDMKPQPTAKFESFLTIPEIFLKSWLIPAES